MKISVIDESTGKRILRDMTEEELNQVELDRLSKESRLAEEESKAKKRAELLDRLGITAEEAALLLG
jgi:hypothetical protein